MSEEADLVKLYSGRILALAASIPLTGRLENPDGSARRRAPHCGSAVTVDLRLNAGQITAFAQDVKACALGQSAASVLGAHVIGCNREEIARLRDDLRAMLKDGADAPAAPFEELGALLPARAFENRHSSILLAIDATLGAIEDAERRRRARS
ncbi:MAG: iron-sulfur cluster assembly scaffold protein [Paracoccaceae bacterium]